MAEVKIDLTELQKDRAQLLSQLQAIQGAIQYINSKIKDLEQFNLDSERKE